MVVQELFLSSPIDLFTDYSACCRKIRWNTEYISGEKQANGYLVQRVCFCRQSKEKENYKVEYYEAWKVEGGKIEQIINNNCDYDDRFMTGRAISNSDTQNIDDLDELEYSIGNSGVVSFHSHVYWISEKSDLYQVVDKWEPGKVSEAGNLKSDYVTPDLDAHFAKEKVFYREPFIHNWDFTDEEIIEQTVSRVMLKKHSGHYRPFDDEIFRNELDQLVPPERYASINMRITQKRAFEVEANKFNDSQKAPS